MTVKNITSFEGIKTDTGDKEVEHFMNVVCNGSTMEPLESKYRVEDRPQSWFNSLDENPYNIVQEDVHKCVCPTPMRECLKGLAASDSIENGGTVDMYSQWITMDGPYQYPYAAYNQSSAAYAETGDYNTSKGIRTFPFHFNNGSCLDVHQKLKHMKTIQTPSMVLSFYVTEQFRKSGQSYDNVLPIQYQTNIIDSASEVKTGKVVVSPCFFVRCVYKNRRIDLETSGTPCTFRAEWYAFPLSWDFVNNDEPYGIVKTRGAYRDLNGNDRNSCEQTLATQVSNWYAASLPKYSYSACECNSVNVPFCYISIGPIIAWLGLDSYSRDAKAISGVVPDPEFSPMGGPASIGVNTIGTSQGWCESQEHKVVTSLLNSPCWRSNIIPTGIGDNAYYDPLYSRVTNGWTVFTYLSEINHSEGKNLENQTRYVKYYNGQGQLDYVTFPTRDTNYDITIECTAKFHARNWSLTFFNQRLFALDKNNGTLYATNAGIESEFLKEMFDFDAEASGHQPGRYYTSKAGVPNIDKLGDWFDYDEDDTYRTKIWGWYGRPSSSSGLAKQVYSTDNTLYLVYDSSVDTFALSNLSDAPITMTYQNSHSPNGKFDKIFSDGSVALLYENCGQLIKVYKFNADGSLALVSNDEMEKRLYRHCKNKNTTTYLSNGKRFVAIQADDKSFSFLYDVDLGYWTEMDIWQTTDYVSFYFDNQYAITLPLPEYEDNGGYWNDTHVGEQSYAVVNTRFFVSRCDVPNFTCRFTDSAAYTEHTATIMAGLNGDVCTMQTCYFSFAPSIYGSRKSLTHVQLVGDNKNTSSMVTSEGPQWVLQVSFDNGKTFNTSKYRVKGTELRMDKDMSWRGLGSGNNSAIRIFGLAITEESQIYAINTEVK